MTFPARGAVVAQSSPIRRAPVASARFNRSDPFDPFPEPDP